MKSDEAIEIVADLAAQQWGLLTTAQARNSGVPPFMLARLADQGILMRIRHGVYAFSSTPSTPALEIRAQWLSLEPAIMAAERRNNNHHWAVVSHETAAELHGIGDLPDDMITFTTSKRRQSRQPDIRFHTTVLNSEEITYLDGLPVTTVARTILDLTQAGHEPGHLRDIITDALTTGVATKDELATTLADVAETFGASSNTPVAMRHYLDELVPTEAHTDELLAQALREVMQPVNLQLQEILAHIQPQIPDLESILRKHLVDLPQVTVSPETMSQFREHVAGLLDGHTAGEVKDIQMPSFPPGAFPLPPHVGQGHYDDSMTQEESASEDKKNNDV